MSYPNILEMTPPLEIQQTQIVSIPVVSKDQNGQLSWEPIDPKIITRGAVQTVMCGVTPNGIAVTPNMELAIVANNNDYGAQCGNQKSDSISVINVRSRKLIQTVYDQSFSGPYTVTINANGTTAYVTNSNSTTVTIVNIVNMQVIGVIQGFNGPSGFAIKNATSTAYVNNYGAGDQSGTGNTISIVNLAGSHLITGTVTINSQGLPAAPAAIAFDVTQVFLYIINYVDGNPGTGTIKRINTLFNSIDTSWQINGLSGPFALAISNNGKIYVSNFGSNNFTPYGTDVKVISILNQSIEASISVGIQPSGIAISENGKFVAVGIYNALYKLKYCNPVAPNTGNFTTNILAPGDGLVVLIDSETNTVNSTTVVGKGPNGVVFAGSDVIVSNFVSNTVSIFSM